MGHEPSRRRLRAAVVVDGPRRPLRPGALGRWLERHAPSRARGSVTIALLTDGRMQALNRRFRGVDRPTDVLSFPAGENAAGELHLGDLAIAVGLASRQARSEGHDLATELRVLALHGLLHLLGYDHETDRGTMRAVEERLRRRAGLPAGLIRRTRDRVTNR
jgi:probable rRNA maturation factor